MNAGHAVIQAPRAVMREAPACTSRHGDRGRAPPQEQIGMTAVCPLRNRQRSRASSPQRAHNPCLCCAGARSTPAAPYAWDARKHGVRGGVQRPRRGPHWQTKEVHCTKRRARAAHGCGHCCGLLASSTELASSSQVPTSACILMTASAIERGETNPPPCWCCRRRHTHTHTHTQLVQQARHSYKQTRMHACKKRANTTSSASSTHTPTTLHNAQQQQYMYTNWQQQKRRTAAALAARPACRRAMVGDALQHHRSANSCANGRAAAARRGGVTQRRQRGGGGRQQLRTNTHHTRSHYEACTRAHHRGLQAITAMPGCTAAAP
jgi:hypothetical protein